MQTLRIKSIKVTGLFGLYEHHVILKQDRVTVIHGPNGVGKTVFLKLTNAFLQGRYDQIAKVPFEAFEIIFSDASVARIKFEGEPGNSRTMHLSYEGPDQSAEASTIDSELLNTRNLALKIAEQVPFISQVGPDEWIDRRTEELIGLDEIIARAADYVPKVAKRWAAKEPKIIRELRSKINVHLIEAQRLIRVSSQSTEWRYRSTPEKAATNTVQEYSKDLKRRLESALATYAKHSQTLDQSFPQRLLLGEITPLTSEQLKTQLQQVEATRTRLKSIGILDNGESDQEINPLQISQLNSLQPGQLSVMSVYAQDTRDKLSILEELSERVEILLAILNRKFTNKRVTISRESGLAIHGKDGKSIPVTALSSGEQHELVLLYDLLFKVKQNTLVLIDEPELSLHISWQKGFMDDLLDIIRLGHFDVLMATHSPYIVGNHSDLLVVLSPDTDVK